MPLGGRFYGGQPRWELGPQRFALGVAPDTTRPEHFQGFHADLIVFIVDEASAVPAAHWEAMKGSALAGRAVIFAIGNPTRTNGEFYDAFHSRAELWPPLAISAFDTPNFQGGEGTNTDYADGGTQITQRGEARSEEREAGKPNPLAPFPEKEGGGRGEGEEQGPPHSNSLPPSGTPGERGWGSPAGTVAERGRDGGRRIPGLVTPEAVEEARIDWGEGSNLWTVRILGQFPKASSTSLVDLEWLENATKATYVEGPYSLGVDVARSGDDETVLALMQGNRVLGMDAWRGQDTMRTTGKVREYADTYRGITIAIDDGGVGGGVVDRLREQGVSLRAVKFGAAPDGRLAVNCRNRLSELYWVLREELQEGKLVIPNMPRLWGQLTRIEWEMESDKVIRVHKRRLSGQAPSPDWADALALAVEARLGAERTVGIFF